MISLFKYDLDSNLLAKSHTYSLFESEDERYTTMIDVIKKYKNTEKNIAFVECNSLVLKCLEHIHTTKFKAPSPQRKISSRPPQPAKYPWKNHLYI